MIDTFPVLFNLHDGTHVMVNQLEDQVYEFHLTRLNSEKHNFNWMADSNQIEESYETRFDHLQNEAVEVFEKMLRKDVGI
jgi:hypothetical protein